MADDIPGSDNPIIRSLIAAMKTRDFDPSLKEEKKPYEICLVNRQIYEEIMPVIYSNVTILLTPRDVAALDDPKEDEDFDEDFLEIFSLNERAWAHNPLLGLGQIDEKNGKQIYGRESLRAYDFHVSGDKDPPSLSGKMEPHIFANFRNIEFHYGAGDTDLDTIFDAFLMDDGPQPKVVEDSEEGFAEEMLMTNVFKNLARILAQSPRIDTFRFKLGAFSKCHLSSWAPDESLDEETFEDLLDERETQEEEVAYMRCIEILLESGKLEPLKKLKNVKTFDLIVWDFEPYSYLHMENPANYREPSPKCAELIRGLKETIEGNWKAANEEVKETIGSS